MTVSVPADLYYSDSGDGVTSQFSYPVRVLDAGELVVKLSEDGVETTQVLSTDYTLSGIGDEGGVTITFMQVPTSDQTVIRYRDTAAKQIVDLEDRAKNSAEAVEKQLDRLTMVDQDQGRRLGNLEEVAGDLDQAVSAAAASAEAAATSETNAAASATAADADADRAEAAAVSIDYLTVADRTALKAVNTTQHTAALIKDADLAGQFIWNSSDLSSEVTVDVLQGTYVAPSSDATGASGAWVRQRGSANHSVIEYGADTSGSVTARYAFSEAVKMAPARRTDLFSYSDVPRPEEVEIDVPDGVYLIDDWVDTHGKLVTWNLSAGAAVINGDGERNYQGLQGRIVRGDRVSMAFPNGLMSSACTASMTAGDYGDQQPGFGGFTDPSKIGLHEDSGGMGALFFGAWSVPPLSSGYANFTANSIAMDTAVDTRQLMVGMMIDVIETGGDKWRGFITGWTDTNNIQVLEWRPVANPVGAAGTPANGSAYYINRHDKVWAGNGIVGLLSTGEAKQACYFEADVVNDILPASSPDALAGRVWGHDVNNMGTYKCASAYIARGAFLEGFRATTQDVGFSASGGIWGTSPLVGFSYTGSSYGFQSKNAAGEVTLSTTSASLDLGNHSAANSFAINGHSSGYANAFDSRIVFAAGGTNGVDGAAEIHIEAAVTRTNALQPSADNAYALGHASFRWSEVFAATGTINTSDGRQKRVRGTLAEAEIRAIGRVMEKGPVVYQWLDAIAAKGENARLHTGFVAQDWIAAFEAEGLDWRRYAAFCEDDEFETVEITESYEAPVMEEYQEEAVEAVQDGDTYVQRRRMVTKMRQKTEDRPLYKEDGSRAMCETIARDKEGKPIVGPDGRPVKTMAPAMVAHLVTETKTRVRTERRPTGEKRLGLRYDQVWAMIFAWMAWNRSIVVKGVREE